MPARSTVCLSFDFDAISAWVGTLGLVSPQYISRGEFAGKVAVPRVLDLLDRHNLKTTWFIPGMDAEAFPDVAKRIRDSGHEIGHHGYAHEVPTHLEEAEERRALERGLDALDRVLGVRPHGYRSPAADLSVNTTRLLAEYDFTYDSSLWGRDLDLYWCRTGDVVTPDEPIKFGEELDVVEVPMGTIGDFVYFEFVMAPGIFMPASTDAQALGRRWLADLDFLVEDHPGGVLTPIFHPQAIARGSKMRLLEDFIDHAMELDVQFKTMSETADEWKASNIRSIAVS